MLRRRELRPREKGGAGVGKTKKGKGTKWTLLVDGAGTPLRAHLDSASPSEVKLLEKTIAAVQVRRAHRPGRPRSLRRYRRRWIVERTFAWLGWCRRLLVRHERLLSVYAAFFHLACAMLTLRQVLK